jgi:hypothetical protein
VCVREESKKILKKQEKGTSRISVIGRASNLLLSSTICSQAPETISALSFVRQQKNLTGEEKRQTSVTPTAFTIEIWTFGGDK